MKTLTGIDLPHDSPGGSVELLRDLYLEPDPLIAADVFMLGPVDGPPSRSSPGGPLLLPVGGKTLSGEGFWSYVDRLSNAVKASFDAAAYDVIHLQHLAFGATPALRRVFLDQAKVALLHGTDLLFADEIPTQAQVLRETAASADAVVVPTLAMADRLRQCASVAPERIVHIPWGVPDRLFNRRAARRGRRRDALSILYAGRLTAEKATGHLLAAIADLDGVALTVAAPTAEYAALSARGDLAHVRYLGWLTREELWQEFDRNDLLVIPSLKLEAFGLVAVEAQACGLPVAYQPVPGLTEVLGASALPIDFGDLGQLVACLEKLRGSQSFLDDLSDSGLANSSRFPLSRTARALDALSRDVAR